MKSRIPSGQRYYNHVKPTKELYRVEEIITERRGSKGQEFLIPKHWASLQTRIVWEEEKQRTVQKALRSGVESSSLRDQVSAAYGKVSSSSPQTVPPTGVYVEIPPLDRDFLTEDYNVITAQISQLSQSSSEVSRDTASWSGSSPPSQLEIGPGNSLHLSIFSSPTFEEKNRLTSSLQVILREEDSESTLQSPSLATLANDISTSSSLNPSTPASPSATVPQSQSGSILSSAQIQPIHINGTGSDLRTLLESSTNSQVESVLSLEPISSFYINQQERTDPKLGDSQQTSSTDVAGGSSSQLSRPSVSSVFKCHRNCNSHHTALYESNHAASSQILINDISETESISSGFVLTHSTLDLTMTSSMNGNTMISPPMQDRVRSIRNSALSGQSRRAPNEDHSPMSSRSTSLAPEAQKLRGASESRPPETFGQVSIDELFPEGDEDSDDSSPSKIEISLPANGKNMEFFLALPLPSRVKSQYDATIKYYKKPMKAFLASHPDDSTAQTMRRLVQRLNNVSTHVDLENEEWEKTQSEEAEDQTKWALSSGSKFVFLHSLCNMLRDQNVHIAIVAKQPQVLYILERFMQGIQVDYVRPDRGKRTMAGESPNRIKVSLIATGAAQQLGPWKPTHLIIAFDGSIDLNDRHIRTLRENSANPGTLTPIVYPMIYCSAEHLSKCIDGVEGLKSELDRLRALIIAIDERQAEVGEMAAEDFRPEAAGDEVGHFILSGGARINWTVLPVRPVKVTGLEILLQDESSPAPPEPATRPLMSLPFTRKRPSEDEPEDESDVQKRLRTSPTAEITHISESIAGSQTTQIIELQQKIESMAASLRAAELTIAKSNEEHQAALAQWNESLAEQSKALNELQGRYEKMKRMVRKVIREKEEMAEQVIKAVSRHEAAKTTIEQLQETNTQAATELEAARSELASSSIPELGQLEQVRQENRSLVAEKAALEKKHASMCKDFEFTRQEYQKASSAAAEHWSRIQDLEQENARLQQKASGEAVRLRELTNRHEAEAHLNENARLAAENEELKEQLKRKERGRGMTTRTGSVAPRSPRLGASPGRSRAGSRAPGSRPQSPVRNFHAARRGRGLVEQSL